MLAVTVLGLAVLGCGPPRESRSSFEVLLGALPAGSTHLEYGADRPAAGQHELSDGTWTAIGGPGIGEGVGSGPERAGFRRGDRALAQDDLVIEGPPDRLDEAFAWLEDASRSAASEPGLLDLARAVGEPDSMRVDRAPIRCGPRWVANATRQATGRGPALGAWVLVYAGDDAGAAAARDLEPVRARVAERPPPGRLLQVDLRPRYIVVTFEGSGGDAVASVCAEPSS